MGFDECWLVLNGCWGLMEAGVNNMLGLTVTFIVIYTLNGVKMDTGVKWKLGSKRSWC